MGGLGKVSICLDSPLLSFPRHVISSYPQQPRKVWDLGNLENEAPLFPDPAADGPPNDTGDGRTWTWRGDNWSGGRSSTTGPQGQVYVPAGHTPQPPLVHFHPPPPHCTAPAHDDFAVSSQLGS